MTDLDAQEYETMWATAGERVSASLDHSSAVAVLGDDPAATGAVALGVARAQAAHRRVFLFDLLGESQGLLPVDAQDDFHGVSDMVHFGVSLARAARPVPGLPNLFVVPGGAETSLTDEILSHRWWETLTDQIRLANALLLVAAPSLAPSLPALVVRLDGVLLVGEARAPIPEAKVLAEVRAAATMRTPLSSVRTAAAADVRTRRGWRMPAVLFAVLAAVLAVGAFLTAPQWRSLMRPLMRLSDSASVGQMDMDGVPPMPAELAASAPVGNEASYSVQLLFTNSNQDALDYLSPSSDSLPGATFSTQSAGADTDRWYRLMAGAFPDSTSADRFLQVLRARGTVTTDAGSVARTPFALLLDSASSYAMASLRVSAYRGRGIPAYVLRDSVGVWRVYAGAFAAEADAQLLKQQFDSLNIQSVLTTRTGSTS